MRNVKFKAVSFLVSASLLLPSVTAHGAALSTSNPATGSGMVKQQLKAASQEWKDYKAAITPKKETIKKNMQTNDALRKSIVEKRAEVKKIIQSIKQSHKQLQPSDLSEIQNQIKVIAGQVSALGSLKGSIAADNLLIRTDIINKNYQDAEVQLDNILSVQNKRTTALTAISSSLDTLIGLLQTAEGKLI
jgi:predicted  nucleic acid-binding Zn-ribbon protein